MHYRSGKGCYCLKPGPAGLDAVFGDVLQAVQDGLPPQRRRSSRYWRSQNRCMGDFEDDSYANWILELSNWMIGCDVSGCFSSRVTDWRYREVGEDESAESERSCPSPLLSMALLGLQCHTRRGSSNW